MTTTIIAPAATTETTTEMNPMIGTWQILLDGQPYGPTWTWKDVAASHVQACRKHLTGCFTLTDARTGETVACDETEERFLIAQEQHELREEQEGWTPAPCAYCGEVVVEDESLDDFRFLGLDPKENACVGCCERLAQDRPYAGCC